MAALFQCDTVRYLCCCGSLRRISDVYFCRHCLRLRCPFCVSHEVDSHYCGNCSENMPSAEAKQKKNRCNSCYDCPCCKQTLSVRASTVPAASDEDPSKGTQKKSYYLVCGYCRWTSKEVNIDNCSSASGPWLEPEVKTTKSIQDVTEYFRSLACREKCAKERKYVHKSKFLAAGRHGLAHLLPKRFPVASPEDLSKQIPLPANVAITIGKEEADDVDQMLSISDAAPATSLKQRFGGVEIQAMSVLDQLPLHKQLLVKRSLRCRVCERNIHKPEYSPVSIKFKIQSNAFYHVPQVRLMAPVLIKLSPGKRTKILVRLSNPIQFPTTVKFLPYTGLNSVNKIEGSTIPASRTQVSPAIGDFVAGIETSVLGGSNESSTDPSQSLASHIIKEVHVLPIREEELKVNCQLENVENTILLPPKDETSDFDDFAETPNYDDDSTFVVWRKANKAAVYFSVKMNEDATPDEPPVLGLTLEYDYVNTIQALENRSVQGPQKARLQAHVIMSLGME